MERGEMERRRKIWLEILPWTGEKTFKYKQSSDWFSKKGSKRFRYSNRPFGILSKAAVSLLIFGKRWGHTGPNLSAIRIPSQGDGVRVGLNLKVKEKKKQNLHKNYLRSISIYSFYLYIGRKKEEKNCE